jgi:exonuclease VII small subunit
MNNNLELILDACVNQIEEGQASLDECLARYPEHAAQLKPLLMAATRLARVRQVVPDPAFKARARTQLNVYMQQHPQRKHVSPILLRFSIAFATVLLLFLASGTAFAQGARPGDALYNWKLTSENVWRVTSSDQLGVDLELSNRRMNELVWASNSGDPARLERAVDRYERLLIKFNAVTDENARARILPVLRAQNEFLINAGVSVPELEIYFPR